jgi:hypothetical protein
VVRSSVAGAERRCGRVRGLARRGLGGRVGEGKPALTTGRWSAATVLLRMLVLRRRRWPVGAAPAAAIAGAGREPLAARPARRSAIRRGARRDALTGAPGLARASGRELARTRRFPRAGARSDAPIGALKVVTASSRAGARTTRFPRPTARCRGRRGPPYSRTRLGYRSTTLPTTCRCQRRARSLGRSGSSNMRRRRGSRGSQQSSRALLTMRRPQIPWP